MLGVNIVQFLSLTRCNINQSDLLGAATAEKTALIERLRAYFDETSRMASLERRANEADSKMKELQQVPWTIFIG